MNEGDDLWTHEEPGVLIRVRKKGQPEYLRRAEPEDLQKILDKAAREFHDPTRPATPELSWTLLQRLAARKAA